MIIDNYALAWYRSLDAEDQNSMDKLFRKFKKCFEINGIEYLNKIVAKKTPSLYMFIV